MSKTRREGKTRKDLMDDCKTLGIPSGQHKAEELNRRLDKEPLFLLHFCYDIRARLLSTERDTSYIDLLIHFLLTEKVNGMYEDIEEDGSSTLAKEYQDYLNHFTGQGDHSVEAVVMFFNSKVEEEKEAEAKASREARYDEVFAQYYEQATNDKGWNEEMATEWATSLATELCR